MHDSFRYKVQTPSSPLLRAIPELTQSSPLMCHQQQRRTNEALENSAARFSNLSKSVSALAASRSETNLGARRSKAHTNYGNVPNGGSASGDTTDSFSLDGVAFRGSRLQGRTSSVLKVHGALPPHQRKQGDDGDICDEEE